MSMRYTKHNGNTGSCSRGRPRRILGSSPPTHTLNLQLNMEHLPLEKTLKTEWLYASGKQRRGSPTSKGLKSLGYNLTRNPTHCKATQSQEGTQNAELLPEEGRVWTPHWGPPAFKTSTWETSPQTSSFEYRRHLEAHQLLTIWEMTLKGLVVDSPAPGLRSWRRGTQIVVNEAHLLILNVGLRGKHRIQHTPGPCWLRAPSSILALVSERRLFFLL